MRLEIRNRIENIKNKNIPIGYKKVVRFIIPNVWEFIEIGKIAKQVSDLNNENKNYNVLSCTKYDGLVDSLRYFKKQIFSNDLNKYKKVHYNYFAYATNHIDEGSIGLQELYDVGLVSPMYTVFKTKEVVNKYLYALLKTENYRRIYKTMMSASVDRRGSLRWKNFSKIRIPFPPYHEQQKIAEILSTCDKLIELKEKLIEQTKQQKKYLMQAFLDPESPNFRRLTGFKGEWKEVKLGDISEITTGKLDANAMIENGSYKFFTCAKESYLINKYSFDTEALLVSGNGANVGYVHYYKGKFNAYQRTYVIDKFKQNIIFIKYMLDKFLRARIYKEKNEGNTPYIRLDTLSKMKIKLPLVREQKSIVDVLSTADQEINLLEKELEQQKLKKKALMQLLLTGKVRVNVS